MWQFSLIYMDNIFVFSMTPEEHIRHTRNIVAFLNDARISLKLWKMQFFTDFIDYLGHILGPTRLGIASHTTNSVDGLENLTNVLRLLSFLDICNVFLLLVQNLAQLAALLNQKVWEGQFTKLELRNETEITPISVMKEATVTSSVLVTYNSIGYIRLEANKCDNRVGCVLLHKQYSEATRPIAHRSRILNDREKK